MTENTLMPVTFHGDTIYCVDHEGQPYAPVKPLVENLGIDWRTQARKLRDDAERWGVVKMTTPTTSGEQETICIPVFRVFSFLSSINPDKVKEEIREKLVRYQTECDKVLWQYWANGYAARKDVRQAGMTESRLNALRTFYEKDCKITGVQVTYALDRAWKKLEGASPLSLGDIQLDASPDDDRAMYVTVTEIGKLYGMSARALNHMLTDFGLQTCEESKKGDKTKRTYMPTELGKQHGGKRFSDSAKNNMQKEVWNLFWHKDKLPAFLDTRLKRQETN